jgi:hypothetical protein
MSAYGSQPTMGSQKLTKYQDIAELMKYGGSVSMEKKYHNVSKSAVNYKKLSKYEESSRMDEVVDIDK